MKSNIKHDACPGFLSQRQSRPRHAGVERSIDGSK